MNGCKNVKKSRYLLVEEKDYAIVMMEISEM